jgi:hypothetical protein
MQTRYFIHTALYPKVLVALSVGINGLNCEGDHSSSSDTEVYNVPIPVFLHVIVKIHGQLPFIILSSCFYIQQQTNAHTFLAAYFHTDSFKKFPGLVSCTEISNITSIYTIFPSK